MKHSHFIISTLPCILGLTVTLLWLSNNQTPVAHASAIIVTNTNDSGTGSLRQAIADAASGDTIIFAPQVVGNIILSEQLVISKSLSVAGPGLSVLAISGNYAHRVIYVTTGTNAALSGLTIRDGSLGFSGSFYELAGGGIFNNGTLTVTHCLISNNGAPNAGGAFVNLGTMVLDHSWVTNNGTIYNGVVYNEGTLTITQSTVSSNQSSGIGPGAFSSSGIVNVGVLKLANVTISGNLSGIGSPGSTNPGALYNTGTADLNNVTVVSNTAASSVGGILQADGTTTVRNSIIAGNSGSSGADCFGTLTSQDFNLIQTTTGCTLNGTLTNVITNTDPLLGPLADNGGPTLTHALLSGSPAIDAGNPTGCVDNLGNILASDQRGFPRTFDGDGDGSAICDIGAYELWIPSHWIYLPTTLH